MKIVNIVPGFGGTFYCGNCLRDSAYTASLRREGHEAIVIPMYLPLSMNGQLQNSEIPVFYGAVNIYLKQQFPFLRKMPSWMERFFNSPSMLKLAAKNSGSTRATGLESLTESMLMGKEGNQSHELQVLTDYLKHHEKPDVVHVSNALLIGLARQIKDEVKVPVICSLQDEDVWVEAMRSEQRSHMWNLLAEKGKDVDAFIAVSHYFGRYMQSKMRIPEDKLHVIPIGIDTNAYQYNPPAANPFVLGYLSRICEENGFAILVDAFILLKADNRFHNIKLKATGGMTGDDRKFIKAQLRKLKEKGLENDLEIIPDFSLSSLQQFFRSITVLSVPVLNGEAFGLYQLEAMASGIPLVQPELGAFPEIIGTTGGGLTYSPNSPHSLAEKLAGLLSSPETINSLSSQGNKSVREQYDTTRLTRRMIELYESISIRYRNDS